jgi:hypothetical protein
MSINPPTRAPSACPSGSTTISNGACGRPGPALRPTGRCFPPNQLTLRFSTKPDNIGPMHGYRVWRLTHQPFEWGRSGEM